MAGPLLGATIATPSLDDSCDAYARWLGYRGSRDVIGDALAVALGHPGLAGRAMAELHPACGDERFIRLVEGPADPAPLTRFGWSALELIIRDLDGLAARLADSPFSIIGPPATLDFDFTDKIRAMQVRGPAGEILYLTEVGGEVPGFDLPQARCDVGPPFIAVGGVPEIAGWAAEAKRAGLVCGPTFEARIEVLSAALGLPIDTRHGMTTIALGSASYLEIDRFPPPAHAAAGDAAPCGIIAVTIAGGGGQVGPLRFEAAE